MIKFLALLLSIFVISGCDSGTLSSETNPNYAVCSGNLSADVSLPFQEWYDISSCFTASSDPFVENAEIAGFSCEYISPDKYVEGERILHIQDEMPMEIALHATWTPPHYGILFGLKSEDSLYLTRFDGGGLSGRLNLSHIPEGDYELVMLTENNPKVFAVLLYQVISAN